MADIETLRAILDLRLEDLKQQPDNVSLQIEAQNLDFEIGLLVDKKRERDARLAAEQKAEVEAQKKAELEAAMKLRAEEAAKSPAERAAEVRMKRETFLSQFEASAPTPPPGQVAKVNEKNSKRGPPKSARQ
jgi:membrane protein involved in colicin uptake